MYIVCMGYLAGSSPKLLPTVQVLEDNGVNYSSLGPGPVLYDNCINQSEKVKNLYIYTDFSLVHFDLDWVLQITARFFRVQIWDKLTKRTGVLWVEFLQSGRLLVGR